MVLAGQKSPSQYIVTTVPAEEAHFSDPALGSVTWPKEQLLACRNDGGLVVTILCDGEISGSALVTHHGELMIFVAPQFRRKGVATEAARQVTAQARAAGFSKLTATARPNTGGAKVVEKLGATAVGRTSAEVFYEFLL
jgi:RimJ/RimL family protein N-acetyltransferase